MKLSPRHTGGRGGMEDLPDAFDVRATGKEVEVRREPVGCGLAPDDGRRHWIVMAFAEADDVFGFLDMLRRLDVHFHVDGLGDVEPGGGFHILGHQVVPGEGSAAVEPGQPEPLHIPEMLVRIENGAHGCRPFRRPDLHPLSIIPPSLSQGGGGHPAIPGKEEGILIPIPARARANLPPSCAGHAGKGGWR